MGMFVRLVWPGLRLMLLPLLWLAWFPAAVIMLAGTGLILLAAMNSDGRIINVACAFGCCSVAALIFNARRSIIRGR